MRYEMALITLVTLVISQAKQTPVPPMYGAVVKKLSEVLGRLHMQAYCYGPMYIPPHVGKHTVMHPTTHKTRGRGF